MNNTNNKVNVPRVSEVTRDKDRERDEREWKRARAEWNNHRNMNARLSKENQIGEWKRRVDKTRSF